MKKLFIVLIITTLIAFTGCSTGNGKTDSANTGSGVSESELSDNKSTASKTIEGEIKFYPTYDPDYKTANNEIFAFWFDIPNEWDVIDQSEDGSEYTILTGDENVHIKMCGVLKKGSEEEYYTSLSGGSTGISDFLYRDGWTGKQIDVSDTEIYYVRVDGDSYMVLHVNANGNKEWIAKNAETINYIAMSARTTRESYGSSLGSDNAITFDDLKLGGVSLDMSYDDVLKAMKKEPTEKVEEEYGGSEALTLFFDDDTQIYIVDGSVYSINVISPDYPTPRGLRVGDSQEKLIELYGEPESKDEGYWGYAKDGYELLTVIVQDAKVSEIQVDIPM